MSEREIRILAGVYCGLGRKTFARVTVERIRYLSAGCANQAAFRALFGDVATIYTGHQVRKTLNDLHRLRLFAKINDGRHNYYSNRLKLDALEDAIFKRGAARIETRLREKERTKKIQARLAAYAQTLREEAALRQQDY